MKAAFCVFVVLLLASSAFARNEYIIDDFFPSLPSTSVETQDDGLPVTDGRFQTGNPVLGDQRDVYLTLTAAPFVTASISVTSSRLSGAYAQDSLGVIRVSWDGDQDTDFSQADVSPGLGGVDFTFNNAFALVANITTDHEVEYTFTIYGNGGVSDFLLNVPDVGDDELPQIFVIPFTSFTGDGDFTDVDAVEMLINFNISGAIDTAISIITIFTYEICGNVYQDCDEDGVKDLTELDLENIDATLATTAQPGVILDTQLSDAFGDFCFSGFDENGGNFHICVTDNTGAGHTPTVPASGCIDVVLEDLIDPPVSEFGLTLASGVSAPADVTLNCGENTNPVNTGFATSSGCTTSSVTFTDTTNGNTCNEVITRTWTSNGFQDVQTIRVNDNDLPFFTTNPQSQTVACEGANIQTDFININAGAVCGDSCNSASVSNTWPGTQPSPAPCGSVSVDFVCTDTCGNQNTPATASYTTTDTTNPSVVSASNQNVECSSTAINSYNVWLSTNGGSSATDNCSGVTVTDNRSGVSNTCSDSDTVTWTYSDVCGNSASTVATFTIQDNTDPNWNPDPQDITFAQCGSSAQTSWDNWLAADGNGAASDACGTVVITNNAGASPPTSCDTDVTVTFTATDSCGRSAVRTADFHVEDTLAPSITANPTLLSVSCSDPTAQSQINTWLNTAGGATTTDQCFPSVTISNDYDGNTANCSGETVTFTICDPCNQCVQTSSTLSIDDITEPVFSVLPQDETAECDSGAQATYNAWLDADGFSTVTDDCTASQNIFISNNVTSGTGGSGGSGSGDFEDKIIIDDFTVQTDVIVLVVPAGGAPPIISDSSFTSGVSILGSERDVVVTINSGDSGSVLTAGTASGVFATSAPGTAEGEVLLQYDGVDGSENLDGNVGLGGLDFTAGDGLRFAASSDLDTSFFVTMCSTGNVCDTEPVNVLGNVGFQDFTIDFVSFSGVDFSSVSAIEFDIDSDTAVDFNLDVISVIGPASVPVPLGCLTETYVGFTAVDLCGNSATEVAIFTVIDTTNPTITTQPTNVDEECTNFGTTNENNYDTWRATNGGAAGTDICATVSITNDAPVDFPFDDPCVDTVVATFFVSDSCGNTVTTTGSYTVRDTTSPVFQTEASDFDEQCGGDVQGDLDNWLATRGGAFATDTCSTVSYTNNFSALTPGCTQSALVTFTAFDECGNADTTSASFTVSDNQPPVILTPAADDSEICDNNFNAALSDWLNTAGGAVVTDACQDDASIQLTNDFNTALADCDSELVTFFFTDLCGQTVTTSATFTVIDPSAPTFTTQASDETVECDGAGNTAAFSAFVNSRGGAVASDNCALSLSFTNNAPATGPVGCGSVAVVFTVTDECGNAASTAATYEVVDTQEPVFSVAPQDASASCDPSTNTATIADWVSRRADAVEFDACTSSDNLSLSNSNGVISGDSCTQLHTYTFSVTDECGNTASDTAVFTIFDLQDPVWDVDPEDVTFECDGFDNTNDVQSWLAQDGLGSASDLCNSVDITNDFSVAPNPCSASVVTFTASDVCGNSVTRSAILSIDDSADPDFVNFPADLTVACDSDTDPANTGFPDATDVCYDDESLTISFSDNFVTEDPNGDCPGDIVLTRTFTVLDPCGNVNTRDQIIRITIARSSGPCDPVGCECDGCCPLSVAADCLPVDCVATQCSSTACASVDCTCSNGKNVHPDNAIERVALPQCEPVYIYVYDDDDSNNTESDLEKPLVVADQELEIVDRRTRRTSHREQRRAALPEVNAKKADNWYNRLFE
eukprot:CAMPEP_0114610612 /NCGR_PEP_ID=MMETSP0168-20121206/3692_1 /TAXON_ID=95228 ORGANISM="Vannella sp., Strain DIVA3 517/6/12" /NCGR_SAMPLE_ID=MMETSP0168 /ASSEMBLY_ACC=CAM_ASM_000044 /LENGTH=1776 /DNA_ID=CAMNT_0001821563 /DNA_START=96 /DNA_END=5426 /DNA_ORIENTATION=-